MMDSAAVALKLPADLARDARELDLLTDEMVANLLREVVDKRVNALVNEEIHAKRYQKRGM